MHPIHPPATPDDFSVAFQSNPDGMSISGEDARILAVNDKFEELSGYTAAEVLGRTTTEVNMWPDPAERTQLLQALRASGSITGHRLQLRHKNGALRTCQLSARFIPFRGQTCLLAVVQDITRQVELEMSVQQAEARYRSIFENALEGIFQSAPNGHFLSVNPAMARIFGYADPAEMVALVGSDIAHRIHVHVATRANFQRRLEAEGQIHNFEAPNFRKDGSIIWTRTQARTVRAPDGQVLYYEGFLEDITQERQAEAALRESEANLKTLVDNTPDILARFDRNGRHLFVNRAGAALSGYTVEALLGKSHRELGGLPAKQLDFTEATIQQIFESGQPVEFETVLPGPSGPIQLMSRGVPEWDEHGDLKSALFIHHDITARKQAEAALIEENRLRTAIENSMHAGVLVIDLAGRQSVVNPYFAEMVGWTTEELLGQSAPFAYWPADEYEQINQAFQLTLQGLAPKGGFELKFIRKSGEVFDVLVGLSALENAKHERLGWLAVVNDITERKQAEAEIRRLNAELEQRVETRTGELRAATVQLRATNTELEAANAALTKALQVKDEFLRTMSHELRTPLTGVLGLAESLQLGVYGRLSDSQHDALQRVLASGQRLLGMVDDVLNFVRAETAPKDGLRICPVLLPELLEAVQPRLQLEARRKGLQLKIRQDMSVQMVQADEQSLSRMLSHLLGNAIKFTPSGGTVGLEVSGHPEAGEVHFTVWDTGIGIAPTDQARIFEPFVQLSSGLTRNYEGAGLGLALVRRLAHLHGGRVTVESTGVPGEGCRFTLCLPWKPDPA